MVGRLVADVPRAPAETRNTTGGTAETQITTGKTAKTKSTTDEMGGGGPSAGRKRDMSVLIAANTVSMTEARSTLNVMMAHRGGNVI
jgi:hypothetical protein